ncbi:MAG: 30S ribosomal protein S5 [Parcubacteria group bacterium]|nr:30S ribosomal protein S5 [Parcubacteria group bacterium]
MTNTEPKNNTTEEGGAHSNVIASSASAKERTSFRGTDRRKNISQRRRARPRRAASDFAQKVIDVRRVARVVAGGRRFSFSVVLVLGDKKGSVGVGIGKASDTARAIEKAIRSAKKNMIKVDTTPSMSIPHEVDSKFGSAQLILIPARGRGLVAGSSVRTVLDLAGLTDIAAKIRSRSKNKLNNARATVAALRAL